MATKGRFRAGLLKLIAELGWGVTIFLSVCLLIPIVAGAALLWPSINPNVGGCKKVATFTLSEGEAKRFSLKDGNEFALRADTVIGPSVRSNDATSTGGNSVSGTWTIGSRSGRFSLRDTDSATLDLVRIASSSYSSSTGRPSSVRLRLGDCTSPSGTK
jgi:hypothetical protein